MSDLSVTTLETFSPELFVEIFFFLNGYDIYKAFYGLNYRLSTLVLANGIKYIDLNEKRIDDSRKILSDIDCSQILTLKLSNKYNDEQIDQLFDNNYCQLSNLNYLRSLTLNSIGIFTFIFISSQCVRLIHPESLIIRFRSGLCQEKLRNIYVYILNHFCLNLKSLKLLNISTDDHRNQSSTSSLSSTEVCSSLQHLHTNNICINNLEATLSFFPNLHTLNASMKLSSSISNYPLLLQLSSCDIKLYLSQTESLFSLLQQWCNLKRLILYIIPRDDGALDSNRWETLIEKYLLKLKQFKLYTKMSDMTIDTIQALYTNGFLQNKFWLDRKTQVTINNIQSGTDEVILVEVSIKFTI